MKDREKKILPQEIIDRQYRTILVVEDDNGLQNLIVKHLKKQGFEAYGVGRGSEAIDYVKNNTSVLMLLDQSLPDMSGKEIIANLNESFYKIPFIIMTGQGNERLAVEMMKFGASDYLVKDIDLIDILPGVIERTFYNIETQLKLAIAEDSLEKALEKNKALLNAIPDIMFILDSECKIKDYFPKNHLDNLYHNPGDFLNNSIEGFLSQELSEKIMEKVKIVLDTGEMEFLTYDIEMNGQNNYFESRLVYFGKQEVLIIERNVTERIKAEKEKEILREQLIQSQKMESIGRLAGGIAHDFNNMLSGIIGASQLLRLTGGLTSKSIEYLDLILRTSERAADLTSKLLSFSRKSDSSKSIIDLHEIIQDTFLILKRSIDRKINIIIKNNAINSNISGDPALIHNALLNMGINSSHAMPDGGTLSFTTWNIYLDEHYCHLSPFNLLPGNYVDIEIKDTGIGISSKNLLKIFDPFFTTKDQGKGTGLGLSTVYGLVNELNGAITVKSEEKAGTEFHLYIPISETDISKVEDTGDVIKGEGCILIIDDESFVREICKDIIESLGYTAFTAINGKDGVDQYYHKHELIDLVILDMIMPEMNGKETYYQLKKINRDVKIIISSGYFLENDILELKENGLVGVIEKPYKIEEISRVIKNTLSR